ncbi:hypothetical protein RA27_16585 [Ruegeria sp. ANG-R]|uniref:hypothetical protein n=1 Tax=Ruegeria sp. ANG-R TaxID=1577903 RepID=UPI00057EDC57|nr:hypothetical protein [Ruegeria sp. ANG-R]KIC39916.1 hypothetical protein RA27_16585 [Ruegeria sp. ANG-R]
MIDTSDGVSSDDVINRLRADKNMALIVVDCLQFLDQTRTNPDLVDQISVETDMGVRASVLGYRGT